MSETAAAAELLTPEVAAAHADLSPLDLEFRRHALGDEELLTRSSFAELDHSTLWEYLIQPWPTFVAATLMAELATASIALNELIKSLPRRVFGEDPERIAEFYSLPSPFLASLILEPPNGFAGALARGDFLRTTAGFRCVELNVTSSLGGWESAPLAEILVRQPAIRRFLDGCGAELSTRDTLRTAFVHVAREALADPSFAGRELNTVFGIYRESQRLEIDAEVRETFEKSYREALAEADPSLGGRLDFCYYHQLELADDGRMRHAGRPVHALIEGHLGNTDPAVIRAFKSRRLRLYNGPLCYVLGDKRNLALLSEGAADGTFEGDERRLIDSYVPWTRRLRAGEVEHRGERRELRELLLAERGEMVLKKGQSSNGDDVHLGTEAAADEWPALVDRCLAAGDWLVQERVVSNGYVYQRGEHGGAVHGAVWGPFVAGRSFGGAMLRLLPRADGEVVNSARGASKSLIFEVAGRRRHVPSLGGDS